MHLSSILEVAWVKAAAVWMNVRMLGDLWLGKIVGYARCHSVLTAMRSQDPDVSLAVADVCSWLRRRSGRAFLSVSCAGRLDRCGCIRAAPA